MESNREQVAAYVQQHGGEHYQAEYQHWDWVIDIGMGYLEGCATKYVSRWRKKNGIDDLKKAITYLEKAVKGKQAGKYVNRSHILSADMSKTYRLKMTNKFCLANGLDRTESDIMEQVACWQFTEDLCIAIGLIRGLITRSELVQEAPDHVPGGAVPGNPARATADPLRTPPDPHRVQATGRVPGTDHPAPFGYEGDD